MMWVHRTGHLDLCYNTFFNKLDIQNNMKHIYTLIMIFGFAAFMINNADAQCFDDGHSPFQNQGWLSCNTSIGPNPDRGDAHWIMYDLGSVHAVDSVYFWNHNVWGETGMGLKSILIDYSLDKENWNTVGPISIEKAPGSWKYTGVQGPSLGNIEARYLLITVLSTWREDASCAGLGEIKFQAKMVVDVADLAPLKSWSISPNPAIDRITIELPEVEKIIGMSLYNSMGQLIRDIPVSNATELILPVDELREGVYFISIKTNQEILTKTFVKGG